MSDSLVILRDALGFGLVSCLVAFAWTPGLTRLLYKYKVIKQAQYDPSLGIEARAYKAGTPVMGGLIIVLTIFVLTVLFNWDRGFTYVPIGVMMLSALLGAVDDLLNVYGKKRRFRKVDQVWRLVLVHKNILARVWYFICIPWVAFARLAGMLSKHPGSGVQVHEKLLLQFIAGGIAAWWLYFKLGEHWKTIDIPFSSEYISIGFWIIPLVILIISFTANAVNIADGMDGLAGGMLITSFGALTILSAAQNIPPLAILNAVTLGALITYTYFNIKPARFYMGDVGSLAMGSLLAINAIALNQWFVLIFIAGMFYIEAASVIIQTVGRVLFGTRMFKMAPIHHHFELIGWSEEKTIMRFWIIHALFVVVGVWLALH